MNAAIGKNVKSWDKTLMIIYTVMLFVLFAVAGLDAGRFGWSVMPITLQVVGFVALACALAVTYWAMATNPFLSTVVRIRMIADTTWSPQGPIGTCGIRCTR